MALKKRDRTEDGRQIVQVKFPGGIRPYAYAVPTALGDLEPGAFVWTQGNAYNPYGSPARVVALGSEYAGELAEITCQLDPGYEPQTITVQRYRKQPVSARTLRQQAKDEEYGS